MDRRSLGDMQFNVQSMESEILLNCMVMTMNHLVDRLVAGHLCIWSPKSIHSGPWELMPGPSSTRNASTETSVQASVTQAFRSSKRTGRRFPSYSRRARRRGSHDPGRKPIIRWGDHLSVHAGSIAIKETIRRQNIEVDLSFRKPERPPPSQRMT